MNACFLFSRPARRLFWPLLGSLLLAACAGTPPVAVDSRPPVSQSAKTSKAASSSTPAVVTKRGGGFYKDDGPGDNPPPDLASIPDADPQAEPLNPFANRPYTALGQSYTPMQKIEPYSKRGLASWYGKKFHGKRTSSGDAYDMYSMTAAHPTLPIPSYARVTNLSNDQSVIVRINDRGPFHRDRLIDLSYTAAWKLGYVSNGSAQVLVESIVPEEIDLVKKTGSRKEARPNTSSPTPSQTTVALPLPVAANAEPAHTLPPTAESTGGNTGIYLQLGAFASRLNADHFKEYVQHELGWLKHSITSQLGGEKYRLHLGPFESVDEARSVAERIALAIKLKPFVVMR